MPDPTSPLGYDGATPVTAAIAMASGLTLLGQDIAARLETPRGSIWYAPNYGRDLRRHIGRPRVDGVLWEVQAEAQSEVLADDRIDECSVTAEWTGTDGMQVTVRAVASTAESFALTLSVSDLTVDILEMST